jgi:hypothetical protein
MAKMSSSRQQKVNERLAMLGFEVTKSIFLAPRLSLLPSFYQDEKHRKWASIMPGGDPVIHEYADLVDCKVVENEGVKPDVRGRAGLALRLIMSPAVLSSANAAKDGVYCTGMSVLVTARTANGGRSTLGIPFIREAVRRDSRMYAIARREAHALASSFLAMGDAR